MSAIRIAPDVTVTVMRNAQSDPDIPLPSYETPGSAGMDLRANLTSLEREKGLALAPGERVLVPTGLSMAIPAGFEGQVRPRSGLALKAGVTVLNAPGTIDSDYRGEVGVVLINLGGEPVTVAHGDRIAQLVLAPVIRCAWRERNSLDSTARGSGGFGSTGR